MRDQSYTTAITVDRPPDEAFAAINDVRGWWSEAVEGDTDRLGAAFTFHVRGVHRCTMTVTELAPVRRVVWHVSDSWIGFVDDTAEWNGTNVVFDLASADGGTEIRFTHQGLVPADECFDICTSAWGSYVSGSLRSLILTGQGDAHRPVDTFETERRKHEALRGS